MRNITMLHEFIYYILPFLKRNFHIMIKNTGFFYNIIKLPSFVLASPIRYTLDKEKIMLLKWRYTLWLNKNSKQKESCPKMSSHTTGT